MIDEAERQSRQQAVDAAVASARIEGVEIKPETVALLDAYVAGEVDDDGVMQSALSLWGPQRKSPPG